MKKLNVVVIGGGYGGLIAAGRLANRAKDRVQVTIVDRASGLTERIRLHQWVAGQNVPAHPFAMLLAGTDVSFRQATVARIDPADRSVHVEQNGRPDVIRYDRLVLATGSGDSRSRVPGATDHTFAIATPRSARALKAEFDRLPPGSEVAICGGGATAIETVTELADARPDLRYTIVSSSPVAYSVSAAGRAHIRQVLDARGIRVIEGVRVVSVEPSALSLDDGECVSFDLAIWAAAFVPGPLAADAGLAVTTGGQLRVDPTLRSVSHPEIYGVGDIAGVEPAQGDPSIRMACATAIPMGAHAGDNIAREANGEEPAPFRFAYQVQCISLGRHDGLLQFVDEHDRPTGLTARNRLGAIAKELICRYTILMVKAELRGIRTVSWPRPKPRLVAESEVAA